MSKCRKCNKELEPGQRGRCTTCAPRVVRTVKTAHGTRVLKRIACSRCGREDTLAFLPKDPTQAYCRGCAEELLGTVDDNAGARTHVVRCSRCGRDATVPASVPLAEAQCWDCLRGIESAQGDRALTGERVGDVVRRRRAP